jgi:hypothetical protein
MHNNTYPWAIQIRQFSERLHCSRGNVELIEDDRNSFSEYCKEAASRGVYFKNQNEAWEDYDIHFPAESPETKMVIEISEEPTQTWEEELKEYFNKSAQFGNLDENGGQQ